MVWNTIAHPKMMAPSSEVDSTTPMPLQYVSTGKQNVYDLILSIKQGGATIAYGDYNDLCAKLVRGELVLCTSVVLAKMDDMHLVRQLYLPFSAYKEIVMTTKKTIHGKPVIFVSFDKGMVYVIDCNNAVYNVNNAPFDPVEPAGDPDVA